MVVFVSCNGSSPVRCQAIIQTNADSLSVASSLMNMNSISVKLLTLLWCPIGRVGISNHQPRDCFLNCLFRQRSNKHQGSASLAFVMGIHQWPVNSPQKGPVKRKMFPFDDVIMKKKENLFQNVECKIFLSRPHLLVFIGFDTAVWLYHEEIFSFYKCQFIKIIQNLQHLP